MSKHLVIGNWKMNPKTLEEAKEISRKTRAVAADLTRTEVVACPPFIYLESIIPTSSSTHFHIGSQNVSFEEGGPHTGEVSAAQLKNLGIEYVIVGHSEVRTAGDTSATVAKKLNAVLSAGLTPVLCVGEKERNDDGAHYEFLKEQIKNSLADVPKKYAREIILAYEPVWAIGAKEAMAPEAIHEMSIFVKKVFADVFGPDVATKITVLYGGSVNALNAADIITTGQVDGLLVGRESVNVEGFRELLRAVDLVNSK